MPRRRPSFLHLPVLTLAAVLAAAPAARAQQGISLAGSGAVNLSMAGASTAAPLDATGAMYWNPATLLGLDRSELDAGLVLIYPQTRISSGISPGALLPGIPPEGISGADRGRNGVFPLPNVGFAYKPAEADYALGVGLFAVGGFGVNASARAATTVAGCCAAWAGGASSPWPRGRSSASATR
jgi:long-chain fatty acid transport protein